MSSQDSSPSFDPKVILEVIHSMETAVPDSIKSHFGDFGWTRRVSTVEVNENGAPRVRFFSDGLDLRAKSAIESAIRDVVTAQWPQLSGLAVYFERKNKSPSPTVPAPESARSGAASTQAPSTQAPSTQAPSTQAPSTQAPQKGGLPGRRPIAGVKRIVAVASGKGGVGKSTVSVNLALALHNQGFKVGLLDADIYGPSLPMMLGIKDDPRVNEKNKIVPPERYGLKVMSFGFFAGEDSAVIWRGPMIMKALQQFFYDVEWGELDVLVIDLPPGTGDAQLTLVQSIPIAGAVIVTTPQNVALLDAVKGIIMFRKTGVPILGVVENMSTFHCPSCGAESHIFGEGGGDRVSTKFEVPLLGHVPLTSELRVAGDSGEPLARLAGHPMRVRFAEIAEKVVNRLVEVATPTPSPLSPLVSPAQGALSSLPVR